MIIDFIKKENNMFLWFLISLGIIVLRLIFLDIDELISFGAEIGNTLVALSTGYLISYIFYFFIVFKKSQNDKNNVADYLIKYLSSLCAEAYRDYNNFKINSQYGCT